MNLNNLAFRFLEFYGTKLHHRGQWRVHAWLRRALRVNLGEELEVARSGLRWRLNPSDYVQADLFWLDSKDPWEIYHLTKMLSRGSVIFDVGANFGYYSLKLASILDGNCSVHAFEPVPSNFERLSANISLNSLQNCIRARRIGLSDREGTASMSVRSENTGAAHIIGNGGDIVLSTLDRYCDKERIESLALIKIDVEGFEPLVLRGGAATIQRCRPIILLELNPPTLKRLGYVPQDVVHILSGFGYELFVPRHKRLEKLEELPSGDDYINVFCMHPGSVRT